MLKKTYRSKVTRLRKRASYQREDLNAVIDEAVIGHLAFSLKGEVYSIPLPFWRIDDAIYCHCSINSRLVQLAGAQDVSVSFVILDAWVLAKSALHHSMNYRSAVVYGQLTLQEGDALKKEIMRCFMDKIDSKRWQQVREPNKKELAALTVMKLPLLEASVKCRTGFADDKKSDLKRDVWAGYIPILHQFGEPVALTTVECSDD